MRDGSQSETALSSPPSENERRGDAGEFPGRLALTVGVVALFFAAWMVQLPDAADWSWRLSRIAPRLSVFALGMGAALALQGGRIRSGILAACAALAVLGFVLLHFAANSIEIVRVGPDVLSPAEMRAQVWTNLGGSVFCKGRAETLPASVALLLMRFECALFAAVFLGTWIGRGVNQAWHFVALLIFGAVCDFWLSWFHVADFPDAPELLALMRLPFVPPVGGIAIGPGFADVLFLSAAFEASRAFRIHIPSLVLGALAGYCSGSFLGLDPAPAWAHLSMLLVALGMLAAAWPDLSFDATSTGKLLLASALMILSLSSLTMLHHYFNPPPKTRGEDVERLRSVAWGRSQNSEVRSQNWRIRSERGIRAVLLNSDS